MSTRTTPGEVNDILDTSLEPQTLHTWIGVATELVDDIAAAAPNTSASKLRKIESLLAAHYATAQDPRASSRSGASRSVSYRDDTPTYHDAAVALDPTNIIANADKPNADVSVPDAKGINK